MSKASGVLTVNEVLTANRGASARKVWNKNTIKILSFGTISLIMYLVLFLNQDLITGYFTKGGFFAVVIVVTTLAFALVYGTFANYVLEGLNFKAVNRQK